MAFLYSFFGQRSRKVSIGTLGSGLVLLHGAKREAQVAWRIASLSQAPVLHRRHDLSLLTILQDGSVCHWARRLPPSLISLVDRDTR